MGGQTNVHKADHLFAQGFNILHTALPSSLTLRSVNRHCQFRPTLMAYTHRPDLLAHYKTLNQGDSIQAECVSNSFAQSH